MLTNLITCHKVFLCHLKKVPFYTNPTMNIVPQSISVTDLANLTCPMSATKSSILSGWIFKNFTTAHVSCNS